MKKEIQKAIQETLVVGNPQSIPICMKKIDDIINTYTHEVCDNAYDKGIEDAGKCDCGLKLSTGLCSICDNDE